METIKEEWNLIIEVNIGGHTFSLWNIAEGTIFHNKLRLMDSYLLRDFREPLIEIIEKFSDEPEIDLDILKEISDYKTIFITEI